MKLKRGFIVTALAVTGGLIAGQARAADLGGYVGIAAGQSRADVDQGEIDSAFGSLGLGSRTSTDETDFGFKVYGGYQFNQNFAVEGGYTHLGKAKSHSVITSGGSGTADGEWKSYSIDVSALGILPLGNQFSLFGRAGVSLWDVQFDLTANGSGGSASTSESENGVSPLLGIGGMINLSSNWSARAEFERHFSVGKSDTTGKSDIDLISVGLQYRF
jgi:OOP family OmpA-OmpF porin